MDASADTLVLENDEDLRYSRLISSRYAKKKFLALAYSPEGDLFSDKTLAVLTQLRDDLAALKEEALSALSQN